MEYTLIRSRRKSVSMSINDAGLITVKAPMRTPLRVIEKFLNSKTDWVNRVQTKLLKRSSTYPVPNLDQTVIKTIRQEFRNDMMLLLDEFSTKMGLSYSKLRISSARTRWGSCSSNKTISLNWRLALVPPELRNYVAVHELAHLKHMNHSARFWDLVSEFDPQYKKHRKELQNYSHFLSRI